MKTIALFILAIMLAMPAKANVAVGAEQTKQYLPLLKGKRVALLSNHTGIVVLGDEAKGRKGAKATRQKGDTIHTLDLLLEHGVNVTAIFSPEHGFRGTAREGELVASSVDEKTGIPILSLYDGKSKRPSKEAMETFDILITDIQYVPNNTTLGVGKANNYIMHIGSGMSGSDCVNHIAIDVNRVRVNTGDPDVLPSGRFVYKLATPTDRQVLEPALIAQLNAIKNGGSYTGNTTISVTGDLASPLTVGVRVATGSGTWQSHNRNGGWAGVYNGSTFKEMRTVNGPDGTGDPPTIKHPSGWKNQRKIGLNS